MALTARETQLADLISQGLDNPEIARELGIGPGSVKVAVSRLLRKTGHASRVKLLLAYQQGKLDSPPPPPPRWDGQAFPLALPVRYTGSGCFGYGTTSEMSSAVVCFRAPETDTVPRLVDLLIDWPATMEDGALLCLWMRGMVFEQTGEIRRFVIYRWEFRTRGRRQRVA